MLEDICKIDSNSNKAITSGGVGQEHAAIVIGAPKSFGLCQLMMYIVTTQVANAIVAISKGEIARL